MDWFTSDTHYGHANIIKYSKRPYSNVEEMNESLIANWNSVVKPGDRVFHLGDFAFWHNEGPELAIKIVKRLRGQKHLIFGNHDYKLRELQEFRDHFAWVGDMLQIKSQGQDIILCHYAMRVWNKSHHGSWQLYGHSHGTLDELESSLSMDVGVDPNHYFPISFEQVKERMLKKQFVPVDRHGRSNEHEE